jgi:hypothetical protein
MKYKGGVDTLALNAQNLAEKWKVPNYPSLLWAVPSMKNAALFSRLNPLKNILIHRFVGT